MGHFATAAVLMPTGPPSGDGNFYRIGALYGPDVNGVLWLCIAAGTNMVNGWVAVKMPSASRTSASAGINSTETQVLQLLLPANSLRAGASWRITASGVCTSTAANLSHFRARLGATTLTGNIAIDVAPTAAASGTAVPFWIDALVTLRTNGATGTLIGSGLLANNGVTGVSAATLVVAQTTATVALDSTAADLIELTYQAAATTTTCTFHDAVIQQVA